MSHFGSSVALYTVPVEIIEEIVKKMKPATLSLTREASPVVNALAARKAWLTDAEAFDAELHFVGEMVKVKKGACDQSSLIYRHDKLNFVKYADDFDFWQDHDRKITASTALMHLEGMRLHSVVVDNPTSAEKVISVLEKRHLGLNSLTLKNCDKEIAGKLIVFCAAKNVKIDEPLREELEKTVIENLGLQTLESVHVERGEKFPICLTEQFIQNSKIKFQGAKSLFINGKVDISDLADSLFNEMTETRIKQDGPNATKLYRHTEGLTSTFILVKKENCMMDGTQLSLERIYSSDQLLEKVFDERFQRYKDFEDRYFSRCSHSLPRIMRRLIDDWL